MTEPKRLTPDELRTLIEEIEEILLFGEWSSGNVDKMGGIRDHIAAQDAEIEALRAVLRDFADGKGLRNPLRCPYCGADDEDGDHDPACPISRARALLKGDSDE